MSFSSYERAREIFDHAETLAGMARESYLREACAGDEALRSQVETLLEAREQLGEFLETPAVSWQGQRIGKYTVEEVIAEGGMGVVLKATQDQPHRSVAVKVIKGPGFSPASIHRFELEAEVLGRLDHPGIARIYEAGMAQRDGVPFPYFVMELIDGLPLTRYVRENALAERDRLELMIKVCEAVHHAHLRGVIHRDLKPSNILVRKDGRPKVLDFGVARITDADVQLTTVHTQVGQILGTLPYMSPEQIRGVNRELDLRSDVYSLGVLCFELLTGNLPQSLEGRELVDAARVIADDKPDTLSGEGRRFAPDLETIVGKCLRKEPDRRYSSAMDLAEDLRRYLHSEPIAARPPSARYQLSKFARRNRSVVAWAVLSLALLVVGLVVSLTGWSVAHTERNRAVTAAQEATELSDFLVELLSSPDPRQQGAEVRVRDLLEVASQRSEENLSEHPATAIRIHQALGLSYRGLGLDEAARVELESAVRRAEELRPSESPDRLVEALLDLSNLTYELGEDDTADSLMSRIQAIAPGGPDDPALRARMALQQGMLARSRRDFETATSIFRSAHATALEELGPEHRRTMDLYSELGFTLWRSGDAEAARAIYEEVVEEELRLSGADHPATLKAVNNLGMMYRQLQDYPQAREMLQQSVDTKIRMLGPDHPSTALGHHNLALVLRELGELEPAIAHHAIAVAVADSLFSESDPRRPHFHAGYAGTLFLLERYEETRSEYLGCYEFIENMYGPQHSRVQEIFAELAESCERLGDDKAAARWRERLVDGQ